MYARPEIQRFLRTYSYKFLEEKSSSRSSCYILLRDVFLTHLFSIRMNKLVQIRKWTMKNDCHINIWIIEKNFHLNVNIIQQSFIDDDYELLKKKKEEKII